MPAIELHATRCAICGTAGNATELYSANVNLEALSPIDFSARRMPDGIRYRMVTCNSCGLVRADPIVAPEDLGRLYRQSPLDDSCISEVDNLRQTYGQRLAGLAHYDVRKGTLLEIGCGTGFLLEEAVEQGYAEVHGVDPGIDAVARASSTVQPNIICDIMRPGMFEPEQFDVVCLFHVFDHIPDPGALLDECWRVLKPGGLILCPQSQRAGCIGAVAQRTEPDHRNQACVSLIVRRQWTRIFTAHGFAVCHVRSIRTGSRCSTSRILPRCHCAEADAACRVGPAPDRTHTVFNTIRKCGTGGTQA